MRKAPEAARDVFAARFASEAQLLEALRAAQERHFSYVEAFAPYATREMIEASGFQESIIPRLTILGGLVGAAIGLGIQVYASLAYPLDVGGRPLLAWPAFMLIVFELAVLFAVGFAITGMLALNRLPRLHHSAFDISGFERATDDRFFLIVGRRRGPDGDDARAFLETAGAQSIEVVAWERPA